MSSLLARQFIEAIAAHDFDAAAEHLDPDVETVTPRGTLHGIMACQQTLQKAGGDDQFAVEQAEFQLEELDGDILVRTQETARWRETGKVAYQRDFALRITIANDRITKFVVMPGGEPPPQSQ